MLPAFQIGKNLPFVSYLSLLGKLTAAATVVPLGLLSLRPLQMWLNSLHLDPSRLAHRHKRVRVSHQCLMSLSKWRNATYITQGVPLGYLPSRREVVHTDASSTGWGATWQGRMVQGTWSLQQSKDHINVLELMAVQLALEHFLPFLQGRHVLVRSDNTTVVYYINHMGGTRSRKLLTITRRLLVWAATRFCSLRATHIPGVRNVSADFLSRQRPLAGEWRLHPAVSGAYMGGLRQGRGGPLCLQGNSSLSPLVPPDGRSIGSECSSPHLAKNPSVCFSTISPDFTDSPQGSPRRTQAPLGGSLLTCEDLVSSAAQALLRLVDAPPFQEGSSVPTWRTNSPSPP